jgi:hypothetical protein
MKEAYKKQKIFSRLIKTAGNEMSVNIALSISENNQCNLGSLFSRKLDIIITKVFLLDLSSFRQSLIMFFRENLQTDTSDN